MESLNLTPPRPDGTVNEKLSYIGNKEYYLRRLQEDVAVLKGLEMNTEGFNTSAFKRLAELSDIHLTLYQKNMIKCLIISSLNTKYDDLFNELKNMLKDGE